MRDRLRIVALGDSTTAGTPGWKSPVEAPPDGAGDETSQYAFWLMKARPDWEVLNRGVNGERTDQILARFDRDVLAERPRVLVIIAGVNDVYQGRPADDVIEGLRALYEQARQADIPAVAGSIIPFNTATADQNARMHRINAWIRTQAAAQLQLDYVDTRAAVAAPGSLDLLIDTPDQLHPSAAGYRLMAEAIRPVIERVLAR